MPEAKKPSTVEAQSVVEVAEPAVTGSMTMREIASFVKNPPPLKSVQVLPPSVERRIPCPKYESQEPFASPVPT